MPPSLTEMYTPLRVLLAGGNAAQISTLAAALSRLQPAGELTTCGTMKQAVDAYQSQPCDVVLVVGAEKSSRRVLDTVFSIARQRGSFVYGGHLEPGGVNIGWCADAGHIAAMPAWAPEIDSTLATKLHGIQAFRQMWLGYTETSRFQLAMLETLREGAVLLDEDDKVIHANRIAERMLAAGRNSLAGKWLPALLGGLDHQPPMVSSLPPMSVPGRPDWRFVLLRNGIGAPAEDEVPLLFQDVLTGLPTHILMQDRLAKAVHLAARYSRNIGLLCLDVDASALAKINETHGYLAGDLVLREVSRRLQSTIRTVDTVARSEGNRFIVILQELAVSGDADQVAQRILADCRSPIIIEDGLQVEVPLHIGLAAFPEHGKTAADLFSRAEAALSQAKSSSPNGPSICRYKADAVDREVLERQLLSVMDDHEMLVYYQPKLSVITNQLIGVEALVRWNCNGAVRGPDNLIAVAEDMNLIGRITHQALRDSVRQAAAWRRAGQAIPVAVNIPPGEFTAELLQLVRSVLLEFDLPPRLLEIEVTESALSYQNPDAPRVMQDLATMGVHLALDDFGTGYSSLERIKNFPFSTLKIDRGFVQAVQGASLINGELHCAPAVQKDMAILQTIVALGKNLQLQIIAEGVEVAGQLDVLRALEVDSWQGFHASPALPAHEFTAWHESWQRRTEADLRAA